DHPGGRRRRGARDRQGRQDRGGLDDVGHALDRPSRGRRRARRRAPRRVQGADREPGDDGGVRIFCVSIRSRVCLSIVLLAFATPHLLAQPVGEAETRKFFSCRTIVTWTVPQGTQVSYLGAGGKSYLWAPGNDTVLSGNWRVDPRATSAQ